MVALRRGILVVVGLAAIATGCTAAPGASFAPSARPSLAAPSAAATPGASTQRSADPTPTAAPTPRPSHATSTTSPSEPTPAPPPWSSAFTVERTPNCEGLSTAIDDRGTIHIATDCQRTIHVTSEYALDDWETTVFEHSTGMEEFDPQVTVDGGTLYLAASRVEFEDGGCGDRGIRSAGVVVRSRTLPNGTWSDARRIGREGDSLLSFRVTGRIYHATVTESDGDVVYEAVTGVQVQRTVLPGADQTSLRVGSDGLPRLAYRAKVKVRYGVIDDGDLSVQAIPGSDNGKLPSLVLGPKNEPYVAWVLDTGGRFGEGCIYRDPGPRDGVYLSTRVDGEWQSKRISKAVAIPSVTLDLHTGRILVLLDDRGLRLFERPMRGGDWASSKLAPLSGWNALIRVDPRDGRRVVVFTGEKGLQVMTRGG